LNHAILYHDLNFAKKIYATKVYKNNNNNTICYIDFISKVIAWDYKKRRKRELPISP
jgi:hypothetical protein